MKIAEGDRLLIEKRWEALRDEGAGFCESWQEGGEMFGTIDIPFVKEVNDSRIRAMYENEGRILFYADYQGGVWPFIGEYFGINLQNEGDRSGDWGKLYLILKWWGGRKSNQGELFSYGQTHWDIYGRQNHHYWYVRGDYSTLSTTVEMIKDNPTVVRDFVGRVFDWDNVAYEEDMSSWADHPQLDLVSEMEIIDILRLETDYGWGKKRSIRKLGYNPDVVKVGVRW